MSTAAGAEVVERCIEIVNELATGEPYRNSSISTVTVRDGRLAAFAEIVDPLVFLQAQGATVTVP
ncbi:hypothetical protein LWC35_17305 [Pseudonocardia kujensis]|uniref:hypothetical protein n=1 Tax=Pseudonocardia kujensis TaxID=1128675 RepID=UPI001E29226A|nr:hypothetical protein [Pseudonocardia kujensis]MCE0764654.1 hypothetical protein [Pseudonocardia kujensis]